MMILYCNLNSRLKKNYNKLMIIQKKLKYNKIE